MTALDLHERIILLEEFIETLYSLHNEHSHWNEEFGEGNPIANDLKLIIGEYKNKLNQIKEKLSNLQV